MHGEEPGYEAMAMVRLCTVFTRLSHVCGSYQGSGNKTKLTSVTLPHTAFKKGYEHVSL